MKYLSSLRLSIGATLGISTLAIWGVGASIAQNSPFQKPTPRPLRVTQRSFERLLDTWEWSRLPWIAKADKPFAKAQAQVEKLGLPQKVKAGQDPLKLLAPFKTDIINHPGDAVRVWKWAVAVHEVDKNAKPMEKLKTFSGVYVAMHHIQDAFNYSADEPWHTLGLQNRFPKPPQSYLWDRMMFIAAVRATIYNRENVTHVQALAERLLRRNPKDTEVAVLQIEFLKTSGQFSGGEKWYQLAITKAQKLLRQKPKDPARVFFLADAYSYASDVWESPTYGNLALANYRRYLQMTPPNNPFRKTVLWKMDCIEKAKAIQAKFKTREAWKHSFKRKNQSR